MINSKVTIIRKKKINRMFQLKMPDKANLMDIKAINN